MTTTEHPYYAQVLCTHRHCQSHHINAHIFLLCVFFFSPIPFFSPQFCTFISRSQSKIIPFYKAISRLMINKKVILHASLKCLRSFCGQWGPNDAQALRNQLIVLSFAWLCSIYAAPVLTTVLSVFKLKSEMVPSSKKNLLAYAVLHSAVRYAHFWNHGKFWA